MVPRRWRFLAAVALCPAVLWAATACGSAATDAPSLVQGALAQQYFDQHHAIPSNQAESQLSALTTGLLDRVYALPAPAPSAQPIHIDVAFIKQTHGDAGVQEALVAAYILHFRALPDDVGRQKIADLIGNGSETPIPVPGLEQKT